MKNLILILMMAVSFGSMTQSIEDRFVWTDKKEYLCTVDEKDKAIDLCKQLYKLKFGVDSRNKVEHESKVPVFWIMVSPDTKSKIVTIYCIEYNEQYDVVYKESKNKDTYFFSIEDYDGETYDLFYTKQ